MVDVAIMIIVNILGRAVFEREDINSHQDMYNFDPLTKVLRSIDTPAKKNVSWSVRKFKSNRHALAHGLFEEYNRNVFDNKV